MSLTNKEKKTKTVSIIMREINEAMQLARSLNKRGYICDLILHKGADFKMWSEQTELLPYGFKLEIDCSITLNGNYAIKVDCGYGQFAEKISLFNEMPTRQELSNAFTRAYDLHAEQEDMAYARHEKSMLNQG